MSLLELRGGWLYEHRPDLFPEGYLTPAELLLWGKHLEERQRRT